MIGIGKFKGSVLGSVEVIDDDPIDAIKLNDHAVSRKIKGIVLRQVQIDLKREIQVHQIWVIPVIIIS